MASTIQHAKITGYATFLPKLAGITAEQYQRVFDDNRHRVYALAFWMTDNELAAEDLMHNVFYRAFAQGPEPDAAAVDRALITELRELMPLGTLTLQEGTCTASPSVRQNILRVHLERAIVELPATERMVFLMHDVEAYEHAGIAALLGITEEESRYGLHQARVRIRNLVATMIR
jgi:RNA polymerase sigma-70 factor (ECF subfamily)